MGNQPIKMDTGNKVLLFIASLALLGTVLFLVSHLAGWLGGMQVSQPDTVSDERVAQRIAPIGQVVSGQVDSAEEAADLSPGDLYSNVCAACHDAGVSGAPIKDDTDEWSNRLNDKGLDTLFANSINGIGAMPARGGDSSLSDEQMRDVVAYMLDEAGVDHDYEGSDNGNGNGDTAAEDAAGGEEPVATTETGEAAAEEEAAAVAAIAVEDGDAERGQSRYNTCVACHGAQGQGTPVFPKLAGRDAEYIADKLVRYRAGETVGDQTALMAPNAANLSDEDIADLAVYVATFED
ncbi:c-type cytochrome [Thioalkalivibrio versutus]|uniref:c-type cytochrome n=1 Tax=Thioalkalivibrio versutus TaxID=106634 RepID=UPI000360BCB3|nr:c-type cytochrome [Thioalkalivibrio versutus]OOC50299.1 cytochrome C class I [Thioalkalivibrio versutus]